MREQEKKDNIKITITTGQIGDETGVIDFMIMGGKYNTINIINRLRQSDEERCYNLYKKW
jgi:hypothetical protein